VLKAEGLDENRALIPNSWLKGDLSHFTNEEEDAKNIPSGPINTAGSVGTDSDGEARDTSRRDRRAKAWFSRQQRKEPLTRSICLWCGHDIYDREGTDFCPNTNHRQRFQDEWVESKEEFLKLGERDEGFMNLIRVINKNRS